MKISILYKFFAVIFAAFLFFLYLNIQVDRQTMIQYRIQLLKDEEKENRMETFEIDDSLDTTSIQQHFLDTFSNQDEDFYYLEFEDYTVDAYEPMYYLINSNPKPVEESLSYYDEHLGKVVSYSLNQVPYSRLRLFEEGIHDEGNIYFEPIFQEETLVDIKMVDELTYILQSYTSREMIYNRPTQCVRFREYENQCRQLIEKRKFEDEHRNLYVVYEDGIIIYDQIDVFRNETCAYTLYHFSFMDTLSLMQEVNQEITNNKSNIYLITFLLSFVVSWLLSKLLSKPIQDLSNATSKINQFDFDIQLISRSHDEMSILFTNIQHMSERLKENIEQLNQEMVQVKKMENIQKDFIVSFTRAIEAPLRKMNEDPSDLEKINQQCDIINELVLDMLEVSRLEAGKTILQKIWMDLEDVLSDQIDECLPLMKEKEIRIELVNDGEEWLVDEKLIQKAIYHFFHYILLKAPKKGCISIHISKNEVMLESNFEENLSHAIFDTYQEDVGLDLVISKTILEMHGFDYGTKDHALYWRCMS